MIIVSQDRETVVNFERINFIQIEDITKIAINYADDYWNYIGEYESKERAKEVLQEIIVAMNGKSQIEMTGEGMTTTVSSPFYEMPEE